MLRFIRPNTRMDTILLVDDSPLRASMRKSLLEGVMPSVARALDAAEALCMVETPEFAKSLALVVTGHVMPGISGPEFVAEFRRRMPQVPILLVSQAEGLEWEYQGISGVFFAINPSAEELLRLANELKVGVAVRQTA